VVGPILKQRHRTAWLAWVRGRRRWRRHIWHHILFSDEFRFSLPKFRRLLDQLFYGQCPQPLSYVPELNKVYMSVLMLWRHTRFSLHFSDERYRVYRRRWKRFTDQCVYESDRFGGESIMVWAGICHDGRTQLKIVQGTLNRRLLDQLFYGQCPQPLSYVPELNKVYMSVLMLWRHTRPAVTGSVIRPTRLRQNDRA
jgi:hypothetical protein